MGTFSIQKQLTVEEYLALDHEIRIYELIDGVLTEQPGMGEQHSRLTMRLAFRLMNDPPARGQGEFYSSDTIVALSDNPLVRVKPDISFVSKSRQAAIVDHRDPVPCAPDFAVEVISPSNTYGEMADNVPRYLAAGTRLVWVVDLDRQLVHVSSPEAAQRRLAAGDLLDGGDVLPGVRIEIAALFAEPKRGA